MTKDDRDRWSYRHSKSESDSPFEAPSKFLVESAGLLNPGRTLDLACGRGRNALYLAGRRFPVIAVDVALPALRSVRRRNETIGVIQMDLDAAGFRANSFENVLCINFLDRRLFPEIRRWLRPHGHLLVDTFLIDQRLVGHPRNPDFLLGRNELLRLLVGYRVLRYEEGEARENGQSSYRASVVAERLPDPAG